MVSIGQNTTFVSLWPLVGTTLALHPKWTTKLLLVTPLPYGWEQSIVLDQENILIRAKIGQRYHCDSVSLQLQNGGRVERVFLRHTHTLFLIIRRDFCQKEILWDGGVTNGWSTCARIERGSNNWVHRCNPILSVNNGALSKISEIALQKKEFGRVNEQ